MSFKYDLCNAEERWTHTERSDFCGILVSSFEKVEERGKKRACVFQGDVFLSPINQVCGGRKNLGLEAEENAPPLSPFLFYFFYFRSVKIQRLFCALKCASFFRQEECGVSRGQDQSGVS